jgi:FKBP-type peptidyl-prolyl cis-trans isomerase
MNGKPRGIRQHALHGFRLVLLIWVSGLGVAAVVAAALLADPSNTAAQHQLSAANASARHASSDTLANNRATGSATSATGSSDPTAATGGTTGSHSSTTATITRAHATTHTTTHATIHRATHATTHTTTHATTRTTTHAVTSTTSTHAHHTTSGRTTPARHTPPGATAPRIVVGRGAPPTTLVSKDLIRGAGAVAHANDTITVRYVGALYGSGTAFYSSWRGGKAYSSPLAAGAVIKGWEEGLVGMRVGGRRELIIPPALGYGNEANGLVPAHATLVFIVDLLAVQPASRGAPRPSFFP